MIKRVIPKEDRELIKGISESVCMELSAALVYSIMNNESYDKMELKDGLLQGVTLNYSRTAFYRFRRDVYAIYDFIKGA